MPYSWPKISHRRDSGVCDPLEAPSVSVKTIREIVWTQLSCMEGVWMDCGGLSYRFRPCASWCLYPTYVTYHVIRLNSSLVMSIFWHGKLFHESSDHVVFGLTRLYIWRHYNPWSFSWWCTLALELFWTKQNSSLAPWGLDSGSWVHDHGPKP